MLSGVIFSLKKERNSHFPNENKLRTSCTEDFTESAFFLLKKFIGAVLESEKYIHGELTVK